MIEFAFRALLSSPIIDQVYQATEGFLACTLVPGHLHLNEDIIFVEKEYLDERRFYPVITDFKRSSQPVYRYKLNDILVENPEPCSCGSHYTRIDKGSKVALMTSFYFEGQDGGQVKSILILSGVVFSFCGKCWRLSSRATFREDC